MTDWELQQIRTALLGYLLKKPVKVSILLQNGLQSTSDGAFLLCNTFPLSPGISLPGQVKYFNGKSSQPQQQMQLFEPSIVNQMRLRQRVNSTLMGLDLFVKDSAVLRQISRTQQAAAENSTIAPNKAEKKQSTNTLSRPTTLNLHSVLLGKDANDDVLTGDFELRYASTFISAY